MKCPITGLVCDKHRCTHITDLTKNGIKETDLCAVCTPDFMEKKNKFVQFIENLIAHKKEILNSKLPCPECNLTISDLIDKGRLGCSHCYIHFAHELKEVIVRSHGALQHVGKVPKNWKPDAKSLQAQLKQAIDTENYEEAARIKKLLL